MDVEKCLEILSARHMASQTEEALACPCRNQLAALECCQPISGGAVAKRKDLGDRSAIELVDDFLRLQEERVQVYKMFDAELKVLLTAKSDGIRGYPTLCEEVTRRLNKTGTAIIEIKETVGARDGTDTYYKRLYSSINAVQAGEKQKLLLVAAKHLDALQDEVSSLSKLTGGKTASQQEYLAKQVVENEVVISEALQEIMSIKQDLIDDGIDGS